MWSDGAMVSMIPKDRTVAALVEVWASIADLVGGIDDTDWSRATPLPGWDVRDNVAHIVGTEAMLSGVENPAVEIDRDRHVHVRNDIGEFNEVWVQHLRSQPPTEVRALFEQYTTDRTVALEAMSQDEWDAESFTPAGRDTYGRFMQIRVFDCWLHEQDIRDALGVPGHESGLAVDVTLDEMTTALGFVVGKQAGATEGQSVTFVLTDATSTAGGGGRRDGTTADGPTTRDGSTARDVGTGRELHVAVEGRATVVTELAGSASVVLTMPVGVMTRLCAGRVEVARVRERIDVVGDVEFGERVLGTLRYTI